MIQPLQYQSMFVPTDIGVMNDQIMKRDAEYSQNEAMLAAAQDKYANVASHPSAVGYKNSLLDELQSNTDKMISDYGGDIGAIDKQTLVKNMNSIRPQIQDLQKHAMLAEEQRKTASKYGVFADVQNDISDYEGWVANGRKEAKVGNIGDYQKYVELGYGDIGSMIRQGGVSKDGDIKGLLKQYQTMGIRADEKEKYKNIIKEDLMETSGTSDAIADKIAEQQVLKLTRGYKQISRNDPGYVKPTPDKPSAYSDIINTVSGVTSKDVTKRQKIANVYKKQTGIYTKQGLKNSTEGKVGTSGFNTKSDDPIANAYRQAIMDENPALVKAFSVPYNDNRVNKMAAKYGVDSALIKGAISEAISESEAEWNKGEAFVKKNAMIPGVTNAIESYTNNFTDIYDSAIKKKIKVVLDNSDLGYIKKNELAKEITNEYSDHNKEVNQQFSDAWDIKLQSGDEELLTKFNFKSVNPYSEAGAKIVKRVNEQFNNFIVPQNIKFHTGEYTGESVKDVTKAFKDTKGKFKITGAGGDASSGLLFTIINPDTREQSIISLNIPIEHQIRISDQLGNHAASNFAYEKNFSNSLKDGQPMGSTGYTYRSDGEFHMLQSNSGRAVTNFDIEKKVNPLRMEAGLPKLNVTGNGSNPYKFKYSLDALSTANLLK